MSESITFDIVESKYPIKISIINQDVITKSESYLSVHLKPDEANFLISMFRFQLENHGFLCKSQNPTPDCIFKLQMRICEVARQNTNLEAENKELREKINLAIDGINALEHLNGELCREDVAAIKETLQQKGGVM